MSADSTAWTAYPASTDWKALVASRRAARCQLAWAAGTASRAWKSQTGRTYVSLSPAHSDALAHIPAAQGVYRANQGQVLAKCAAVGQRKRHSYGVAACIDQSILRNRPPSLPICACAELAISSQYTRAPEPFCEKHTAPWRPGRGHRLATCIQSNLIAPVFAWSWGTLHSNSCCTEQHYQPSSHSHSLCPQVCSVGRHYLGFK